MTFIGKSYFSNGRAVFAVAFVFFSSCILTTVTTAQSQVAQLSFSHVPYEHYSPRNSDLKYQTWSVIQDFRGLTYIADEDGIKVFDGQNWSRIITESGTTVRSLAASATGKIYYGAQGEFGQIMTDSSGTQFASAIGLSISEGDQAFSDVWSTHTIGDEVFFQSRGVIFHWNGQIVERIQSSNYEPAESKTGFHTSFVVGDKLYVREHGTGLKVLDGQTLVGVPKGQLLSDVRVYMMYQIANGEILIGTQEEGLLILDDSGFRQLPSELDVFQKAIGTQGAPIRLYSSARISDSIFAIGTLGGGIVIINSHGDIVTTIDSGSGLPDDWINNIYIARDRTLWVALNNSGAAYIDLFTPLVRYRDSSGVPGRVNHIARLRGSLVISTGAGLFALSQSEALINRESDGAKFDQYAGINLPWYVEELESQFAVASGEGVKIIPFQNENNPLTCSNDPALFIIKSSYSDLVFVGTKTGLLSLSLSGDECSLIPFGGVNEEIWSLFEESASTLWIGTRHEGIVKLDTDMSGLEVSKKNYLASQGLPNSSLTVTHVGNHPIFYSEFGPYRFIEEDERFELYTELWPFSEDHSDSLFTMTEDHRGNVWMVFPDSVVKASPNHDGTYAFSAPEALKFKKTSTSSILVEEDDVVWFNDGNELIRYDSKLDSQTEFVYNALVSRVSVNGQPDAIFNGSFRGPSGNAVLDQPSWAIPILNYDQKDLSLRVAATTYTSPSDTRFQIWTEGKDDSWSAWSDEHEYYITGLEEGTYTFHVRARNSSGRLSREAAYSFVILPPWYRTWWAYLMYVTLGALLVYSSAKYYLMWRASKLAAEQAEELAREREVNKVLQEANERLTKANRLKDEFLATTSHELRTPLTAILGFTSVLREEIPRDADYREFLDIIEDSGSRLMETLNSLLDLAKLRAGMMEINLETSDIYYQCTNAISEMQAAAERKGLELFVERPSETLFVDLDVLGFLRILQNLIGNAIKFTETGHVKIVLEPDEDLVHMKICDTGIGIDEEFIPRLFDEFMQESDGPSRSYEGFGLGLAITARLVRLMNGDISVESYKGEGSQFTVSFPRAKPIIGQPIAAKGFGNVDHESSE